MATITIDITDELERRLERAAAEAGMTVSQFVSAQVLRGLPAGHESRTPSHGEFSEAFHRVLAEDMDLLGRLP